MLRSMWSCGIAFTTFYSTCPLFSLSTSVCICLCLHLCVTVIYLYINLEVTGSVFLSVLFSFNFSFYSFFLLKPLNFPYLFPISWILLSTLSSLTTWRKIHCFIYTVLYLISSVTTANAETSCISNCSLVKKDKSPSSTSFFEVLWEGMSEMPTAKLMAVIVEIPYLSGTLYPSLLLSPRYSIWRVCIVTFHRFTERETETPHGHMAYPRLQNRTCIQIYVFAMVYA